MSDRLDSEYALMLKQKPWLDPDIDGDSWWVVTSEENAGMVVLSGGGVTRTTLVASLARVTYEPGSPVFIAVSGVDVTFVPTGRVAYAARVHIVLDRNPHEAAYKFDQDNLDLALASIGVQEGIRVDAG